MAFTRMQRCLLPCDDLLRSMYLFWKSSYYLTRSADYAQVLTGVLPYRGSSAKDMITDIRAGRRPSRPMDSSQGRLLQGPVWNIITAGWHDQPNQRCELSAMYRVFRPPSIWQQLGKSLPRIASPFQSSQTPESEIQMRVNKMHEVTPSTSPLPKADMTHRTLRTSRFLIGSDWSCSITFVKRVANIARSQRPCASPTARRTPWKSNPEALPMYHRVRTKGVG